MENVCCVTNLLVFFVCRKKPAAKTATNKYIIQVVQFCLFVKKNFIVRNDSACYGHAVKYLFQERNVSLC